MQGRSQAGTNPSLGPEPVGSQGDRALSVLLRSDDLNLGRPLLDDIPGEKGAAYFGCSLANALKRVGATSISVFTGCPY